jgi:hypothetical protein
VIFLGLTAPVSSVGGAEEEILQNDHYEVPEDDLPTADRLVERRDFSRRLAVIVW